MDFEPLYDHCYRADNLRSGDRLPAGGSLSRSGMNFELKLDSDEFYDFFGVSMKNAEKMPRQEIKAWLEQTEAKGFDADMFCRLYAFSGVFKKMYPQVSENFAQRKKFFSEDKPLRLSESFDNKVAACLEIAALAQIYLQKSGIESRYFSGELMTGKNDEFAEEHCFVTFNNNGKNYIFDAARPLADGENIFPNINEVKLSPLQIEQFEKRIHPPKDADPRVRYSAFMETENILTRQKTYYGVNDRRNVFPEFIMSSQEFRVPQNYNGPNR